MIAIVLAALAAFDLDCSGTETVAKAGTVQQRSYAEQYRIDLASRRWCRAGCTTLESIAYLNPNEIGLVLSEDKAGIVRETINRRTLAHRAELRVAFVDYQTRRQGACRMQPFSGFSLPLPASSRRGSGWVR
jgi:hypothetical protein